MKLKNLFLFFFVLYGLGNPSNSQTLDQSQLLSNSGISARTLPGYRIMQSFTCGITGTLTEIDLGVFNYINGAGTLEVYAGNDNLGSLLQTLSVNVTCASGNCFAPFTTSVSVTAGEKYAFLFTPGAGIPDPYGVLAQLPGNYAGGEFGLIDPSGTYFPGWDLTFKTFVTTPLGVRTLDYDSTSIQIYPNPCSTMASLQLPQPITNGTVTLFDESGRDVLRVNNLSGRVLSLHRDNLPAGIYSIQITENGKWIGSKKLILGD